MQIAKMFASLGFKVDVSGLNTFKKELDSSKPSVTKFSVSVRNLSRQLNTLGDKLIRVNQNLKFGGGRGKKADDGYRQLSNATEKLVRALDGVIRKQPSTTKAFGKIHASLITGTPYWKNYADQVARVRDGLISSNQQLRNLRNGANQRINLGGGFGGGNRGGGYGSGGGNAGGRPSGGSGSNRTSWLGDSGYQFFRSMAPTALISTGLAGLGYGLKEVVQRGREQTRMESKLLFSSQGKGDALQSDYKDSLEFVRSTGLRLGIDSAELGAAFAQVNQTSSEVLTKDQRKSMFTDMSEYIMTTGADRTDQKLIMKAVNQMFSLGRIMAEEMNQLTERGIPRKMIYDVAKDVYGYKTTADVIKAQEAGKLKGEDILPEVFKRFATMARETGAMDKMMQSSGFAQNQASEAFNQTAKTIMDAGLDKALASMFFMLKDFVLFVKDDLIPTIQYLLKPLNEIAEMLGTVKGMLDAVFGSGWTMITMLGTLGVMIGAKLGLFAKLSLAIFGANAATMLWWQKMMVLFQFLGKFIFRLGAVGLAFWVLYKVAQAVNARMNGEMSWADVWGMKFQVLLSRMDLFFAEVRLKYMQFRLWLKSFDPTFEMSYADDLNKRATQLLRGGVIDSTATVGNAISNMNPITRLADDFWRGVGEKLGTYPSKNSDTNFGSRSSLDINLYDNGKIKGQQTIDLGNSANMGIMLG